jgi:hypothetical protein
MGSGLTASWAVSEMTILGGAAMAAEAQHPVHGPQWEPAPLS